MLEMRNHTKIMKILFMCVCVACIASTAYADLEGSMDDLQGRIMTISTPIAIILLILAAWLKMSGRNEFFFGAIIGSIVLFAAPQIVEFIQGVFN